MSWDHAHKHASKAWHHEPEDDESAVPRHHKPASVAANISARSHVSWDQAHVLKACAQVSKVASEAIPRVHTSKSCYWWSRRRRQGFPRTQNLPYRSSSMSACRPAPMHTVEHLLTGFSQGAPFAASDTRVHC